MIVLIGKGASGKSEIATSLSKLGMKRIKTYTTRQPRENELLHPETSDYYFVSEEDFLHRVESDFFLEYKSYTIADGSVVRYGSSKSSYTNNIDGFTILTPSGVRDIKGKVHDLVVVQIDAPDDIILERMMQRNDKKEAMRRIKADNKDFESVQDLVDFTIINDGSQTPDFIAQIIMEGYVGKNK